MPVAVVTGASRGLGLAVARELSRQGWDLVVDARHEADLRAAAQLIRKDREVVALAGNVTHADHRADVAVAASALGGADLLVNNASALGPSPMPQLAALDVEVLADIFETNVVAPLALFQALLPQLTERHGRVVNVTSDAAIEPYAGWGGYGSSKAALNQLSAILAEEHPDLRVYAFDPGDMRTQMHQYAFPGEDISDRPEPHTVVPAVLRLAVEDLPSGRHRADSLLAATTAGASA